MHPEQLCSEKEVVVQVVYVIMLDVLVDYFFFLSLRDFLPVLVPAAVPPTPAEKEDCATRRTLPLDLW